MKKNFATVGVIAGLGIGGLAGVTVFSPGASNAQSATAPTASAAPAAKGVKTDDGDSWHGKDQGDDRAAWVAREAADGTDTKLLAQAKITPSQAAAAAVAVAPGTPGTPDLHARNGALSYHVEVATATGRVEVRVDATTGIATIDSHRHDDGDAWHGKDQGGDRAAWVAREAAGTDAKLLAQAKITPSQAAAAAVAVVPGTPGTPDLHARNGALSYHVEVATATGRVEVRVDATTGIATIDNHRHDGDGFGESNDHAPSTAATA